jgi:mannonate dehydratase
MVNNRREFIIKGTSIAAMSVLGINSVKSEAIGNSLLNEGLPHVAAPPKNYIQDAGIKMCLAYFAGIEAERRKIEFGKQLNFLGAVGKISPLVTGSQKINPWEYEAVLAEKNAWDKVGLKLEEIGRAHV